MESLKLVVGVYMHQLQLHDLTYQQALNLAETGMFNHLRYSYMGNAFYIYQEGNLLNQHGAVRGVASEFLSDWTQLIGTWEVFNMA